MELICLGDSLTFGFGVRPSRRWTALAARESGWRIINRGINGDTTGGMLSRLPVLLSALPHTPAARRPHFLVMGGSNDVFFSGSDLAARGNMGAIVHQLITAGITPLVGIPTPVVPAAAPVRWAAAVDFEHSAAALEAYCLWLRRFCAAFDVSYIDFRADFVSPGGSPRQELFFDGLHPSEEGHRIMAGRLTARLQDIDQLQGG